MFRLSCERSSAGLGGIGPASNRSRFSFTIEGTISLRMSSAEGFSFVRSLVIPLLVSLSSKSLPRRGFLISSPSSITFFSKRAKLTARLAQLKVFPSPAILDVNIITLSFSLIMNCRFVRIVLNTSSIWLFWFACTTMSAFFFILSFAMGTSAMIGSFVSFITSSCASIL